MDARPHERQGQGVAPAEEGRRVRGRGGAHGTLPGVGPVRADGGGAARRSATDRDAAPAPDRARRAGRRHRAARGARHARHARRGAPDGSGLALRDQVRRRAGSRPSRRRHSRASRPERPGRHQPVSRGGRGSARASARAVPAGRRDRRARRRGALELSAAPGAHGSHAPRRRRTRARRGAGRHDRLRRARAGRPRSAPAAARDAQGMFEAPGAGARRRVLRRSRRGPGRRVPGRRLRAAARGRDRQEARQSLRLPALEGLAQDQVLARAGVRHRRLHRSPGHSRSLRRAPPRPLRGRPARLRLQGRHGVRRPDARARQREAPAAGARDIPLRARHPDRARPPLGRASARVPGSLHGVDARRGDPASGVPRFARRQTP